MILSKIYLRKILKFEIEVNYKKLNVELVHRKNMRHTYLRLLKHDLLQIKANKFFTLDDAKNLVNKKLPWIEKSLLKIEVSKLDKNQFYFLGEKEDIFEDKFNLVEYYRQTAKEIIPLLVEKHSNIMGLEYTGLKFRNNKRTWGSCSYRNSICLNINLMKFPKSVIEYVIIHELAHIVHKNHSKKFWELVAKFCPNYKEEELLLKSFL